MRTFLLASVALGGLFSAAAYAAPPMVGPASQASLASEASTARAAEGAAQSSATTAGNTATTAQTAATSATNAVTALAPAPVSVVAAGTTQATATAITTPFSRVTSAPSGTGIILSVSLTQQRILDRDPANPVLVYPPSGATIEGQAINLPVQIASGSDSLCTQVSSGVWNCGN